MNDVAEEKKIIQRKNTVSVELAISEFQLLVKRLNDALQSMAGFDVNKNTASDLREKYSNLYAFIHKHACICFYKEFEKELMFGLHVTEIDMVNGVIGLSFSHTQSRKNTTYRIKFKNSGAPYTKTVLESIDDPLQRNKQETWWSLV